VVPAVYSELPIGDRYTIARLIGEITHHDEVDGTTIMLLGPGRWGTTTPALGVPVSFAEISPVSTLCEIVAMRENLIPDVSLGTHFFNELVENSILYLALFPNKEGYSLNRRFLENDGGNRLADLLPAHKEWAHAIRVIASSSLPGGGTIQLNANTLKQRVVCYRE